MRISHNARLIYYAIPKTASQAVRTLLDPISDEPVVTYRNITAETPFYSHMRPCEAEAALRVQGRDFSGYFRFATVRNPWARLASLYKMATRNKAFQRPGADFSDWLQTLDPSGAAYADMSEKWYAHGAMSMTTFLSDPQDGLLVDQVFRIEDQTGALQDALARQTARIGQANQIGPRLEQVNAAPRSYDWRQMYSNRDRQLVAERYADDIAGFGYAFGG